MKAAVFGAGASYGASRHGDFPPPLVTGILPSAVKLGLFDPTYAESRHLAFIQYLRDSGANDEAIDRLASSGASKQHLQVLTEFIFQHFDARPPDYATVRIDFERLFALTEAELLGYHAILRHHLMHPQEAAQADVLDLQIRLVLCGTLIAATRDVRCDFHNRVAEWLRPGDISISFNYDTLLDRSLRATGNW